MIVCGAPARTPVSGRRSSLGKHVLRGTALVRAKNWTILLIRVVVLGHSRQPFAVTIRTCGCGSSVVPARETRLRDYGRRTKAFGVVVPGSPAWGRMGWVPVDETSHDVVLTVVLTVVLAVGYPSTRLYGEDLTWPRPEAYELTPWPLQ